MLLLDRPDTTADPLMLHAFARRGRPLGVSELLNAMSATGLHVSDVLDLLVAELAAGRVAVHGYRFDGHGHPFGPLLYELAPAGQEVVEADRLAVA